MLYLNNQGSRWIMRDRESMKVVLVHKAEGYRKVRQVEYYESFGNFAAIVLKYKGKRISCLSGIVDDETGWPVCYVDYKEKHDHTENYLKGR